MNKYYNDDDNYFLNDDGLGGWNQGAGQDWDIINEELDSIEQSYQEWAEDHQEEFEAQYQDCLDQTSTTAAERIALDDRTRLNAYLVKFMTGFDPVKWNKK